MENMDKGAENIPNVPEFTSQICLPKPKSSAPMKKGFIGRP